ncbi:hypothetical protein Trydic_g1261 [Trypoxylus dichotomus]
MLKTKKEKIPPILGTRGIINNNFDKTEEFANHFEGIFRPNPPMGRDHEKSTDVINKQMHTEYRGTSPRNDDRGTPEHYKNPCGP